VNKNNTLKNASLSTIFRCQRDSNNQALSEAVQQAVFKLNGISAGNLNPRVLDCLNSTNRQLNDILTRFKAVKTARQQTVPAGSSSTAAPAA
jgi:hypothetical protein